VVSEPCSDCRNRREPPRAILGVRRPKPRCAVSDSRRRGWAARWARAHALPMSVLVILSAPRIRATRTYHDAGVVMHHHARMSVGRVGSECGDAKLTAKAL